MAGRAGFEPAVELYTRQPLSRRPHSTTLAPPHAGIKIFSGGRGIRTHGGLPHTCFQDRRLKPLGHPSIQDQILPACPDFITKHASRQETQPNLESKNRQILQNMPVFVFVLFSLFHDVIYRFGWDVDHFANSAAFEVFGNNFNLAGSLVNRFLVIIAVDHNRPA